VGGLSGCLRQEDSVCFNRVVVRVRRNASDNVEVATVPSTSRPLLSSTVNVSLESTADQSNVSSMHNASLHLPPNSTLHPTNVTNSMNDITAILEVSRLYGCCEAVGSHLLLLTYILISHLHYFKITLFNEFKSVFKYSDSS